jgi:NADP-dependent aldehyde dehydrogenase
MSSYIDGVCRSASSAFDKAAIIGPPWTSDLLRSIARELEEDRDEVVSAADEESHLGVVRLQGELNRTIGQLEGFASWSSLEYGRVEVHDKADSGAMPPTPDLQRLSIPIGPIAVFAASNFPLAFGVMGGDAASALAAGNPVVARAHPLQVRTALAVFAAVVRAIDSVGAPRSWFQLVDNPDQAAGEELVSHPAIRAVGFTGSHSGGMALALLASQRPVPIPVYAEMGSINPLFVTTGALMERRDALVAGLVGSITQGAGQFCTKPGLIVVPKGDSGDEFVRLLTDALRNVGPQIMLATSMMENFAEGFLIRSKCPGVMTTLEPVIDELHGVGAGMLEIEANRLTADHLCMEELFGPAAVVVRSDRFDQVVDMIPGSLTVTIHSAESERRERAELLRVVGRRAGRVVHNGFPTGVAVKAAMQHGGPFPASNHDWATSVGLASAQRFRRPLVFQSWPELWTDVRVSSSASVPRTTG